MRLHDNAALSYPSELRLVMYQSKELAPSKDSRTSFACQWAHVATFVVFLLICSLLFFRPSLAIVHIDDLFFAPWAIEFAETGKHTNELIREYFPGVTDIQLQPRLHIILSGWFLSAVGANSAGIVAYQALCFVLCSCLAALVFVRQGASNVAVCVPFLMAPFFALSGFRVELTGVLFFLAGCILIIEVLCREKKGADNEVPSSLLVFAKLLLAVAPLAAPALFAWSLGMIIATDLIALQQRRLAFQRLLVCNMVALAIALCVFSWVINFEYQSFFSQFIHHSTGTTGTGVNVDALVRSFVFLLVGVVLYRRNPAASFLVVGLALGQFLAGWLHDKSLIRNVAAALVFGSLVGSLMSRMRPHFVYGLLLISGCFLSMNLLLFYGFTTSQNTDYRPIIEDVRNDNLAGKRVLVDEVTAQHALNYQLDGLLAWTWSKEFPATRPSSVSELPDGTVWYLSKYRLYSYLKGRSDLSKPLGDRVRYETTPFLLCVLGRNSCRMPKDSWGVMRWEKVGDEIVIKDYDTNASLGFPDSFP